MQPRRRRPARVGPPGLHLRHPFRRRETGGAGARCAAACCCVLRKEGKGVFFFADGGRYEGEFACDVMVRRAHGRGGGAVTGSRAMGCAAAARRRSRRASALRQPGRRPGPAAGVGSGSGGPVFASDERSKILSESPRCIPSFKSVVPPEPQTAQVRVFAPAEHSSGPRRSAHVGGAAAAAAIRPASPHRPCLRPCDPSLPEGL